MISCLRSKYIMRQRRISYRVSDISLKSAAKRDIICSINKNLTGCCFVKIHIIGCSGSGKTYLANALAKKYNIPHFDLDDIQWDNNAEGYGTKRPLEERNALLQEILNNNEWVIEGVYYAWVQQSFDEADKIYVLDMPRYLYKSRIIIRSIKRKLGIQQGKRETLKSVYNLLKWTETFQNKNLKEIKTILEKYENKVIWLSSKNDVREIIKAI